MITQNRVKKLVEYRDGMLFWKVKTDRPQQKIGDRAGSSTHNRGYRTVRLDKMLYLEHRIIWLYHYGTLPARLDHRNEIKTDNRVENLRISNNGQNMQNRGAQKNNTSGYKGVAWLRQCNRWMAQLNGNGKHYYIGIFKTKKEAALAYNKKAVEIHGEFAKINIIK